MRSPRLPWSSALTLLAIVGVAVPIMAQRNVLPPGSNTNAIAKGMMDSVTTTDMSILTPIQLAQTLIGSGVTISNVVYSGAPMAAGTFTGGTASVGFSNGVILSSGNIASVPGPNTSDSISTDTLTPGDTQLSALSGFPTFNASSLDFDFIATGAATISFQYVFSSEEYNEWVTTQYNDIFGFFLNGTNIALLPGGSPVTINTVNCGNPYAPGTGTNCALYINNSCVDLPIGAFPCPGAVDTEMDGLTVILTATGTVPAGTNHIRLIIADAGDEVYDSNVFIRAGSFSGSEPAPFFETPSPCGHTLSATVGVPFNYTVVAKAATGLPSNAVTLTSGTLPAGSSHLPALPQSGFGQNATASTEFRWTPQIGDVGNHTVTYVATDQLSQSTTCIVAISVSEPVISTGSDYLFIGLSQLNVVIPNSNGKLLLTSFEYIIPVTPSTIPVWVVPPQLYGYHLYGQFGSFDPLGHPNDPILMSNGLDVHFGVSWTSYGPTNMGIIASLESVPRIFEEIELEYEIQD